MKKSNILDLPGTLTLKDKLPKLVQERNEKPITIEAWPTVHVTPLGIMIIETKTSVLVTDGDEWLSYEYAALSDFQQACELVTMTGLEAMGYLAQRLYP